MRRALCALAVTAALLATAQQVAAQTVPQPQPVPIPTGGIPVPGAGLGSSGLLLSVWDTTTPVSLVLYTGLTYNDVLPSTNMTSDAGLVLDFGTVQGFTQTFGSNNQNLRYTVFAADGLGGNDSTGFVTTSALGSDLGLIRNTVVGAVVGSSTAGNFYGQLNNSCNSTNPCVSQPGLPTPFAGAATWGDTYNSNFAVGAGGDVGTALGFYWIDRTASTSPTSNANVVRYGNSANLGQWLLTNTGQFSYSLVAANVVPLPAAAWLLLSGLAGIGAVSRRTRAAA